MSQCAKRRSHRRDRRIAKQSGWRRLPRQVMAKRHGHGASIGDVMIVHPHQRKTG
jgi:hypothetical protein